MSRAPSRRARLRGRAAEGHRGASWARRRAPASRLRERSRRWARAQERDSISAAQLPRASSQGAARRCWRAARAPDSARATREAWSTRDSAGARGQVLKRRRRREGRGQDSAGQSPCRGDSKRGAKTRTVGSALAAAGASTISHRAVPDTTAPDHHAGSTLGVAPAGVCALQETPPGRSMATRRSVWLKAS